MTDNKDALDAASCLRLYKRFIPEENKKLFCGHIETIRAALEKPSVDVEELKNDVHEVWCEPSPNTVDGWESCLDHLKERGVI